MGNLDNTTRPSTELNHAAYLSEISAVWPNPPTEEEAGRVVKNRTEASAQVAHNLRRGLSCGAPTLSVLGYDWRTALGPDSGCCSRHPGRACSSCGDRARVYRRGPVVCGRGVRQASWPSRGLRHRRLPGAQCDPAAELCLPVD